MKEIEFYDWQFKNIEELIEAIDNGKFPLLPYHNHDVLCEEDFLSPPEGPLKMNFKDKALLRKLRLEKIKPKFGDKNQIRLMNILRRDYLIDEYYKFINI